MNPNLAMFANMAFPGRGPIPAMGQPGPPPMTPPGMAPGMSTDLPPGMPPGLPPAQMPLGPPPGQSPGVPQGPSAPPAAPPQIDPSRVIHPAHLAAMMRAHGRGGDSMMAHMTPGEIAVPPQVQTPEVLTALNKAFASAGANPTSFQAGNPDQKINPETGVPEFGFFDALLPMGLGLLGSLALGPAIAGFLPELGSIGGASLSGIAGSALGGAAGTTAGNLLEGKPIGEALGRGAIGGLGSGIGGAIGASFGSGPTPVPEVGPTAGGVTYGTGLPATGIADATGAADAAAAAKPSFFADLISKQGIGSGIGGFLGGSLADSLYAPNAPAADLGPSLGPPGPMSLYGVNAGSTAQFPGQQYLRNYGRKPQFNFFPA